MKGNDVLHQLDCSTTSCALQCSGQEMTMLTQALSGVVCLNMVIFIVMKLKRLQSSCQCIHVYVMCSGEMMVPVSGSKV